MRELTDFQEKCVAELTTSLRNRDCEIRSSGTVNGRQETYIEIDLGFIKLWIYTNGACWQGHGRDRVFEVDDYDSIDGLQRAFIAEILTEVEQGL